jgi:hypothetical protein
MFILELHRKKNFRMPSHTPNMFYIGYMKLVTFTLQEEFEDAKEVIRIRISKKNRQHYDEKKKSKRTNNDQQNIHIKLKIE